MSEPLGVLLMSFGTAASLEDIPAYLARIRGGRPAPDDLVDEFKRRYQLVGASPLTRITLQQAEALEAALNGALPGRDSHPHPFLVAVGMRHSEPFIANALADLASRGVRHVIAIIMAPQHSPLIMAGYHKAIAEAKVGFPDILVTVPGPWHTDERFSAALSQRLVEALDSLTPQDRREVPVIFTAHSVPKVIVDQEPQYIGMLRDTASSVAEQVRLLPAQWQFAYQSAGHTPQEWLKPDIKDLFPAFAAAGKKKVLIAPVQFLADHMEVLYDIDVEARQQAAVAGIELLRIEMLNTMPAFIEALAQVVLRDSRTGESPKQ